MARCIAVGFLESSKSRIQCTHCISRVRTSFASHKMLNGDWLIPVLSSDPQQPLVGALVFHYATLPELKLTQAIGRITTLLTMSTSPALPIELCERVIDHLSQDRNALITCMLVCRAWCPRSRFHLGNTREFPTHTAVLPASQTRSLAENRRDLDINLSIAHDTTPPHVSFYRSFLHARRENSISPEHFYLVCGMATSHHTS